MPGARPRRPPPDASAPPARPSRTSIPRCDLDLVQKTVVDVAVPVDEVTQVALQGDVVGTVITDARPLARLEPSRGVGAVAYLTRPVERGLRDRVEAPAAVGPLVEDVGVEALRLPDAAEQVVGLRLQGAICLQQPASEAKVLDGARPAPQRLGDAPYHREVEPPDIVTRDPIRPQEPLPQRRYVVRPVDAHATSGVLPKTSA